MNAPDATADGAPDLRHRLADSAMVLDLLGTLPGSMDEGKAIEAIRDLFAMLCAPAYMVYVPFEQGREGVPQYAPGEWSPSSQYAAFASDGARMSAESASGKGFFLRLALEGETLGILEVEGLAFPQYTGHYRNLALTVGSVCGLAIHNARTYRQLREALAERERAERAVAELNVELERRIREVEEANRELEAFTYAVSHDLRAPLRAVSGYSHILAEDYGANLPGEAGELLEQVLTASSEMSELIDGLLQLSRSTRGNMSSERVNLSVMAAQILESLAASDPSRRVAWHVEPELYAEGDTAMLRALLTNLLSNAWKYTAHAPEPVIRFYREEDGGEPRFCVSDNGAGFNMEFAAKLFQPFQRLHRQDEFPGIGIGLATAQRIVRRHGGDISAVAAPGQGATFRFSLARNQAV